MPRVYPPGHPPSPPRGRSKLVLAGVIAALAIVVAIGVIAYFTMGGSPTVKLPTPPGWEPAGEEMFEKYETLISEGGVELTIDYLFSDGSLSNSVAIVHGNYLLMQTPESDELEDVKAFYEQHREEIMDEIEAGYGGQGISYEVEEYEVVELACGSAALRVRITLRSVGAAVVQDYLIFIKDGTEYTALVTLTGLVGGEEEMDFLIDNISFK